MAGDILYVKISCMKTTKGGWWRMMW